MTELEHKETRNVLKQEIQFLPTHKEKCHEKSFTTFKHYTKFLPVKEYGIELVE